MYYCIISNNLSGKSQDDQLGFTGFHACRKTGKEPPEKETRWKLRSAVTIISSMFAPRSGKTTRMTLGNLWHDSDTSCS